MSHSPDPPPVRHARKVRRVARSRRSAHAAAPTTAAPSGGGHSLRRSGLHLVMVGLLVLTLSLLVNFVHQVVQSARLEAQRVALEREVAQLHADTDELQGAVEFAESDVYVERVAREELGYAREGDVVLVPQGAATPTALPAAAPLEPLAPEPPPPNWQGWWDALFVPSVPAAPTP